ncbi:MAG: DUF108 domain-containing protein [Candidatus Omnitrophota bacterium]|nr:DUF108 domain-containing protein [Candidatus Omnitrophota bacterium]MDZ4241197.1 aspartate dehydrogenase domain-containing protein [Candidatus Omnitrophota bacterium]
MKPSQKVAVGIVGCGAIGSRIAKSVTRELKSFCRLTALYDIDLTRAGMLERNLRARGIVKRSFAQLLNNCDLMVEAVSAPVTRPLIRQALSSGKNVLAMSVGKLLNAQDLFALASRKGCKILIPSGAIAGIDALKAAGLVPIQSITLTTRKPVSGFANNPYIKKHGIDLAQIRGETVLFEGGVAAAVKAFPQNINVAATLALASRAANKLTIRILTSPDYQTNSHEIEVTGESGRITTRTDNVVCPDNPKTSYLAVLSGIQTLREFCLGARIGT